jgi:hypothetical protein
MFIQEALHTTFISELEMPRTFDPSKMRQLRLELAGTRSPWHGV